MVGRAIFKFSTLAQSAICYGHISPDSTHMHFNVCFGFSTLLVIFFRTPCKFLNTFQKGLSKGLGTDKQSVLESRKLNEQRMVKWEILIA